MFKRNINITRIKKNNKSDFKDTVLIERPIDLYINSYPLVSVTCLPKDLKELAIGFIFSIGVINSINEIKNIVVNELENRIDMDLKEHVTFNIKDLEMNPVNRIIDTSCGIPSPWRNIIKKSLEASKSEIDSKKFLKIKAEIIFTSMIQMQKKTVLFKETGGCHGAAIFNGEGSLLGVKEDIGRHNAIDKIIGDMLIKKKGFDDVFLTTTGRLTGDSVLKAIRARIPIVASLSAAIESGIRLAFAYRITLIGFVRGKSMNIYSHPERIELN